MKKTKKRRMRLSEEDLAVVLKLRGLNHNPYHIVNSNSTYRLTLTREEEDAVAKDRATRAFDNCSIISKIVKNALSYIFEDYQINICLKNKITGNNTYLTVLSE